MIIDFHSHFFPMSYLNALTKRNASIVFEVNADGGGYMRSSNFKTEVHPAHHDVHQRVAAMDEAGIDFQCLTPTIPGVHTEDAELGVYLAQQFNDGAAEMIAAYPERFTGIAVLPLQDPAASVTELERAITQLDLRGGALFTNINGQPIDDPAYRPLFEKAIELDIPLWLHPTTPPNLGLMADYKLVVTNGFMFETTLAISRLIFSGMLEQHPGLKLVLSQMGGTLPFIAERIERGFQIYADCRANISISPTEQLKSLWYDTTPGTPLAIQFTAAFAGTERLMMGSDFPQGFGGLSETIKTIHSLDLSDEAKAAIMGGNARRLLKI